MTINASLRFTSIGELAPLVLRSHACAHSICAFAHGAEQPKAAKSWLPVGIRKPA